MTEHAPLLFEVTFLLVVPFWALMVLAPGWSVTRRVLASPVVVVPPLVVFALAVVPQFGTVWAVVTRPSLDGLHDLLDTPLGTTAIWAQVLAWDLFVGRWMYLDSRARRIHPVVMAPVLVGTILLSPFVLPLYLALRRPLSRPASGGSSPPPPGSRGPA